MAGVEMTIRLSDLPPELRRRVLQETGFKPGRARLPRVRRSPNRGLMRICSCRFEIFRPDGIYPEICDGCGSKFVMQQIDEKKYARPRPHPEKLVK